MVNEDHIMINNYLLHGNEVRTFFVDHLSAFVADGVGGNQGGDFASRYVLENLSKISNGNIQCYEKEIDEINIRLLEKYKMDPSVARCATTLSGILMDESEAHIIHVGDCELWLLRNNMFFKMTKDHVLDADDSSSVLINYLGISPSLLYSDIIEIPDGPMIGDLYLLCSDGLMKCLSSSQVKMVLLSSAVVEEKIRTINDKISLKYSSDDVSVILIEPTHDNLV